MDSLWQDLRFAVRTLRQTPLATGLALLILALGIGANTAIFSVVDAVLLSPLPFPRPERLMVVWDHAPRHGFDRLEASAPNFHDWREQSRSFAGLDAYYATRFVLTGGGARPASARGAQVSGDFFRTLGARPERGRLLRPEDDRPGAEPVAMLSYGLWRTRYGGDPGVIGRRVEVDGRDRTVVGVTARGFGFPSESALWVPFGFDYPKERRGAHFLSVVGRLRPGATRWQAEADLSGIAARLGRQYPDTNADWGVAVQPLREYLVEDARPTLVLLLRVVWVVLFIACANVANLLLSRTTSRRRELAVRAALGAGRARLARQLLVESVVLFAAGGALGLLLAALGTRALRAVDPDVVARSAPAVLDGRVLLYTFGLSLATGLLVGSIPAASAAGGRLYAVLKEGGRAGGSGSDGGRGRWLRDGLVVGEVALAVALLVAAGLLLRSFVRLRAVDPGFSPREVMTFQLSLPAVRYSEERRADLFERTPELVAALPGVRHAAVVYPLPLTGEAYVQPFSVAGRPKPPPSDEPRAEVFIVSPDYFATLGVPVLAGRAFTSGDRQGSLPAVIVNRALARRVWPGRSPLGQRIVFDLAKGLKAREMTVVGIVGDVRALALHEEAMPQAYWPQAQRPLNGAALLLRAERPQAQVEPVRRALRGLDRDVVLDPVETLDDVMAASIAANRVEMLLVSGFGALALLLAAVGIYGLVSFAVARRTHEIGIRMALGAGRGRVLGMVIGQGMTLVAAGLALGLVAASAAGRLVAARLYEVGTGDLATYLAAPLLLAAVALLANWLPARRATRIDPLAALRAE